MRGPQRFDFAISRRPERALVDAEQYRLPFLGARGRAENHAPLREHAGPALSGASMAALRRRNGAAEARIVNQSDERTTARLGDAVLELRPWEIRELSIE